MAHDPWDRTKHLPAFVTLTLIATYFRRSNRTDGGTAGLRDEMKLVMVLPGAAQHTPSRAGRCRETKSLC